MQGAAQQRSAVANGLLVAVPALVGAGLAGVIAFSTVEPYQRATGVVQLSEIAGNAPAGQLNPYAADLETALASAPVQEQVQRALGAEGEPAEVEVERLSDASRVSISLEARTEAAARRALLAAGRAGYAAVVQQQVQLLRVRELAAVDRLAQLDTQLTAARRRLEAAPEAEAVAAGSAVQQSERLAAIAVEDLSQVQGQLAVAEQLASGVGQTTAVVVDAVEPVSPLPQVLPVVAVGLVGGGLTGAAAAAASGLRRRSRQRAADEIRRPVIPTVPGRHDVSDGSSQGADAPVTVGDARPRAGSDVAAS